MSMYPSLEDMEVDKLQRAQAASQQATVTHRHGNVRRLSNTIELNYSRMYRIGSHHYHNCYHSSTKQRVIPLA